MYPPHSWTTSFPPPRSVAGKRLNKARHITLPYIVVLSMTSMILATIYAYCVHQNNHDRASTLTGSTVSATNGSTSTTSHSLSIFGRQSANPSQTAHPQSNDPITTTPPSQAALVFYSATLPLLSLTHGVIEATLLKFSPATLTASGSRFSHYLLGSTLLLTVGWIVTTTFWTHCEIITTLSSSTSTSVGVCPPQIRNHLMYGILNISIAKSAIGWALVVGYLVHTACLLRWLHVVRRWQFLKSGMSGVNGVEWEPEDKLDGRHFSCVTCEERGIVKFAASASAPATKSGWGRVGIDSLTGVKKVTVCVGDLSSAAAPDGEHDRYGPPKVVPSFDPPPKSPRRK